MESFGQGGDHWQMRQTFPLAIFLFWHTFTVTKFYSLPYPGKGSVSITKAENLSFLPDFEFRNPKSVIP
jgi:hypothetical protein